MGHDSIGIKRNFTTEGNARPRVGIGTPVLATLSLIFGVGLLNRKTVRKRPPVAPKVRRLF
jgi:hypothetical protein